MAMDLGVSLEEVKEMDYETFRGWQDYFEKYPVGWREDLRTYYIMRAFGVEEKPEKIFPSLKAVYAASRPAIKEGQISVDNLQQSKFFQMLTKAQGGKHINEIIGSK